MDLNDLNLKNVKLGFGITGSFCTFDSILNEIAALNDDFTVSETVLSKSVLDIDSRFGKADDFYDKLLNVVGKKPLKNFVEVEPLGPKNMLDVFVIAPCTGNTLAKLANGITDTSVTLAAKGHLRNNKPLVISVSTNDALSNNLKNIGLLMNTKNVYFVPFKQDNPELKPNSMISDISLIKDTILKALSKEQLQPVIL